MRRRRRLTSLIAVACTAIGTAAALVVTGSPASATTFTSTQVDEAPDYATTVFKDPWDYSNPSDLLLDNNGPAMNLTGASISGGTANLSLSKGGYVSPLWTGYPNSQLLGRDGAIPANNIDADFYTRLHLHVYASQKVSAAAFWFTCGSQSSSCWGGAPFSIPAGWSDLDLALVNNGKLVSGGKPWAGSITGLRLALTPTAGATNVKIDFVRVYHPNAGSRASWGSPAAGQGARLFWSDGTAFPTSAGRNGGPVVSAAGSAGIGAGGTATTDLSGYPAGTVFYAVADDGTLTPANDRLTLVPQPTPVIDSPTAAGCGDYATSALGHPWTFTSTGSLAGYGNIQNISFSGGAISATNGPPVQNDPYIYLPVGKGGIDGRIWNRFTITESYVGPFNLADTSGGGTMARIVWRSSGQANVAQTKPLVTYSGKRTLTVDLGQPASQLTDPSGAADQKYPFAATAPVTQLRWDPNEDRGTRRWSVYSVRLAKACSSTTGFTMTWHDDNYAPGSTAKIIMFTQGGGGSTITLADNLPVRSGSNTFDVPQGIPDGTYLLRVTVTGPTGISNYGTSGGPLVVRFFPDVPSSSQFYGDIKWLVDNKITTGYPDGLFKPTASVTRQSMAAYLYRYARGGTDAGPCTGASPFDDVPANSEFCGDIDWLSKQGITGGYPDGGFHPSDRITRQAIAAFLYRFNHGGTDAGPCADASAFADVDAGSAFCGDIAWLANTSPSAITTGYSGGGFHPAANTSRQAMAAYLHRYEADFAGYGKG
jgi:hypothetical protein